MTPRFPRVCHAAVLKTPPDPRSIRVRDFHPLWCSIPKDFCFAEGVVTGCVCLGCDAVASPLIGPHVGYAFAFLLEQAVAAQERGGKRLAFLRAGNAAEASGAGHRTIVSQDVLPALFRHLTSFVPHAGKPSYGPLYLRAAVPLAAPCLLCVLDPG